MLSEKKDKQEKTEPDYTSSWDFEMFRGNVLHAIKNKGDLDFIESVLVNHEVETLMKEQKYQKGLYLLAAVDYLSRINDIPTFEGYDNYRTLKLKTLLCPPDVVLYYVSKVNENVMTEALELSIPEFKEYNIIETDIREVA